MTIDGTIGFVGTGNMAEALIRGLVRGKVDPARVAASAPRPERTAELAEKYKIFVSNDNGTVVERSKIVVLSVKPQIMRKVLDEIAPKLKPDTLVISIAAGIPLAAIETRLPAGIHVIRTMPNTPALVDAGATAIARGAHATAEDLAVAKQIFDSVGITVTLDEAQLDAVTGLSGSGPAYIFLILEALSDAGVKVGLSRRTAQLLAAQTVLGSAKLLMETKEHPGQLKDMVTSPGGTAIAGLHTLEAGGAAPPRLGAAQAGAEHNPAPRQATLVTL